MGHAAVLTALRARPADGLPATDLMRLTGLGSGRLYAHLVRLERAGHISAAWHGSGRKLFVLNPSAPAVAPAPARHYRPLWVVVVAVAGFAGYRALARPAGLRLTDLAVYTGAVDGLRSGASLYDFIRGDAPFTYPPFAGLVMWPLAAVPTGPLQLVWTLATVAIVVTLAWSLRTPRWPAPLLAVILLLSAPVSSNLRYGQVSIGIAALVLLDLLFLRRSRYQGVATGIAAAIKLTPLMFLVLLWCAGRRRPATVAGFTFAACAAVAVLVLPGDSLRFWGTEMWHVSRLGYIDSVGNQSLNGALIRLGIGNPERFLITAPLAGAVAVVALRRAADAAGRDQWLAAAVIAGAASVVVSPVSWTHHQIWLVLAALLPVGRWWWPATVLAVMLLPVTAVWCDGRLLLAVVVAAAVPYRGRGRPLIRTTATNARQSRPCQVHTHTSLPSGSASTQNAGASS
jgi:alpha-1,2-mannosyltransferase